MSYIGHNAARIRERIHQAAVRAGRNAEAVRLIAVTKSVGQAEIRELWNAGIREMAENRVERGSVVVPDSPKGITWRLIGPLQRRKTLEALRWFHAFDAVDRVAVAETLQRRCDELDLTVPILLEVNVSGEASKHGFAPSELDQALREIRPLDRLKLEGLMTMAPWGAEEKILRTVFRTLRQLAEARGLHEISMGMSDDFEIAVEEGSTMVRIGRALFEAPVADTTCVHDK
ncbi:MAG TPA: YggS family pyridoxal phosphate-dependent enzyme [Candidatus Hydrogenedentes bacterium]|nr:YggS family pyridoxal phosphate-dependent enzyme [Candidatus Hydrogenedentota bacterium]